MIIGVLIMTKIEVYTTDYCPFCKKAKAFLQSKGLEYEETDITMNEAEMRAKLSQMTGGKSTVPQIFINGESIGGYTDIIDLEKSGKLDELLGD